MFKLSLYITISLFLLACSTSTKEESEVKMSNDSADSLEITTNSMRESLIHQQADKFEKLTVSKKGLVLQFDKATLCFDSIVPYESTYYRVIKSQKDTTFYDLDLGESVDFQFLKVIADSMYEVQIYQQIEASFTIMDEGPHCDLVDWNHYYSPWRAVKTLQNNQKFRTLDYRYTDWEKLFRIDLAALKQAVLDHCGDRWFRLVKNAKSPYQYPFGISESKVLFKIVLIDKQTHKKIERIAVFYPSMGC
jgi:hypothetical protein